MILYKKFEDYLIESKGPDFSVLKKNKVPLTPEEHATVYKKKAVWNGSMRDSETGKKVSKQSAVWKSVVNGKTWYVTNTHRAFNSAKTLDSIISKFHDFIKGTA